MGVVYAVVIVGALVWLIWASGRARELCVVAIEQGRLRVVRGALPASLREALQDIVTRQRVQTGKLRFLRDGDAARLEATVDAPTQQRMRNVLGTYPLARLLAAQTK
jgi:Protein of unknown function (DUF3634)